MAVSVVRCDADDFLVLLLLLTILLVDCEITVLLYKAAGSNLLGTRAR
jgi:hypothetical protein